MIYAIIGGDARMKYLAQNLAADNTVLDCTEKLCDISGCGCVILPVPAENGGFLSAPLMSEKMSMAELISLLPENAPVCGGRFSPDTVTLAEKRGLHLYDIMNRADFTVGNAELTAEGAISILMNALPYSISGARVLVVGFGRIGKLLSRKLSALGASVTVMSENAESRAMARALGYAAQSPDGADAFDIAVNTAPARVLKDLGALGRSCLLLELASAPGGIDKAEALRLGMEYVAAPGLPGRYAPKSAGELIAATVKSIVKEQNT